MPTRTTDRLQQSEIQQRYLLFNNRNAPPRNSVTHANMDDGLATTIVRLNRVTSVSTKTGSARNNKLMPTRTTDWLHRDEIQLNNLHRMEQGWRTGYTKIRFNWKISTERNRSCQDPGWPWTKLELAPLRAQNFVNLEARYVNSTFINRSLSSLNQRKWDSFFLLKIYIYMRTDMPVKVDWALKTVYPSPFLVYSEKIIWDRRVKWLHTHTHMAQCNEFAKVSTNNSAMMNRVQRGSGGGGDGGGGMEKKKKKKHWTTVHST